MTNRLNEEFACYDEQPDHYVPATPTTTNNDIDANIEELRTWLAAHQPREDWPAGQRQAYSDRISALAGWLARSQRAPPPAPSTSTGPLRAVRVR